ncbi:MAG TPA: glycosyltransferase [Gammaproteobacteria bacterium]|nr:glycosyltransferase [Gammaproteobacteria bacterium]
MSRPALNPVGTSVTPCAVIPLYNHYNRITDIVAALRKLNLPVIIVDDGSNDITRKTLRNLEKAYTADADALRVHYLPHNQGKGAAVMAGLKRAQSLNFSHAVQIDADGQHDIESLPDMLAYARQTPAALISGKPVYNASVPKSRLYGRYITHFWVAIETLSRQIEDTMCGLRVYPVDATLGITEKYAMGQRMDFDTEIMVRMYWEGYPLKFLPVSVHYPADGLSHFQLFADNWRISRMHTRLVLGMLPRIPRLLRHRFKHKSPTAKTWATIRERGSSTGMRFVTATYRLLGRRVCALLLGPISTYFFLTHKIARQASHGFLTRTHKAGSTNIRPSHLNSLRHFYSFASSLLDKVAIWSNPKADTAPVIKKNYQILQQALDKNRGLLLLSAHIGNLEFCRALATANSKLRINALVYTRNAEKFNHLLESLASNFRFRLLLVDKIGMDTGVMLRNLVDQGEIVVIVGDRTPVNESGNTIQADFLGQTAFFATGPYVLAHILECPVQLLFCVREGKSHIIHLEHFEDRIHLPRRNRQQEISRLAQNYADRLAHYAVRYPFQWFNFFDFWAVPEKNQAKNPL